MLSEADRAALSDIAFNIDLALTFTKDIDYDQFVGDYRTFYAITRCLELFPRHPGAYPKNLKPVIPTLRGGESPAWETSTAMTMRTCFITSSGPRCMSFFQCLRRSWNSNSAPFEAAQISCRLRRPAAIAPPLVRR
jgi:hypothetical protein